MILSPSLCSLSFLTSSPSLSMTLSDHRVLSQPWVPPIYFNKLSLDGSLHAISSNLGVLSYKGPKTLIAHYSKSKQPFQLILALYSPRQKPERWHWVLTVLRGLNAEITSERFVIFCAMQCSCLHTRHYIHAAACTPDTAMQLLAHQTLQCSRLHTRHYHVAACTPDITMQPPAHQTLQCSRLHTRHYNAFT